MKNSQPTTKRITIQTVRSAKEELSPQVSATLAEPKLRKITRADIIIIMKGLN